jgi:hypothetical protein
VMRIMELLWPPSGGRRNRGLECGYRRTPSAVSALSEHEPISGNAGNGREGRGLAGWLLRCWHRSTTHPARLTLIERIALGPKHFLALIEAEGVRLLVATSADGTSAFFSLEGPVKSDTPRPVSRRLRRSSQQRQAVRRLRFDGRIL